MRLTCAPMAAGTVSRLWRWPVKSMAGEELEALRLDGRGVGGDRAHAVLHPFRGEWQLLTARLAPRLLAWTAAYTPATFDPAAPPPATVTGPDGQGSWRWDDPGLPQALEADLGRPVRLLRDAAGVPDVPGTVLLTTEATLSALRAEMGAPVDARRFRMNLHLALDAPAWAEERWEGREVVFAGGVRLRLRAPCDRCAIPTRDPDTQVKWPGLLAHLAARHGQNFGIRADVLAGGRIEAGEGVRLEAPGS